MTDTILSSSSREVVIGFDRPFTIIGERINPTGRKLLAEEMKAGDFSRVERDAIAQVEAGAHMLDVNAGIPLADEPAILARTIQLVQSLVDVPLSIDSSIVMPIGAMATAGQQVFRLVRRLREELGVNTTCGASNVSFGMPDRERINAAFLPMAIASGLTSAITNPLAAEVT